MGGRRVAKTNEQQEKRTTMAKNEAVQDQLGQVLGAINTLAQNMTVLTNRMTILEQKGFATNPGNATFTAPAYKVAVKAEEANVPVKPCNITALTDPRAPYICFIAKHKYEGFMGKGLPQADGFIRNYYSKENPGFNEKVIGWFKDRNDKSVPVREVTFTGTAPIGRVFEVRDGFGLSYGINEEKGFRTITDKQEALALVAE